ncbi:MAG: hypothetical protein AAF485_06455 [Chloroflexota bacterium]
MAGPVDFSTVQWARKMGTRLESFEGLAPADLLKLSNFLNKLAEFQKNEGELSDQQRQVILQTLHIRDEITRLEVHKGGVYVEFSGGGYVYERFLIRADGKVPNNRYETQKA